MISSVQELLEQDEGRRTWPYTDTRGNLTWGIGHRLSNGVAADVQALLDQAIDRQFQHDQDAVVQGLQRWPWFATLDPVRQAALIDMAFNLGLTAFSLFAGFLNYMGASQWTAAAADLRDTLVYQQLPARYERLATMIESGQWPSS
jgi:lysozyme